MAQTVQLLWSLGMSIAAISLFMWMFVLVARGEERQRPHRGLRAVVREPSDRAA